MKRTIELTHEQLDLLVNSLFVASSQYQNEFKAICERYKEDEAREAGKYWADKSNLIYDLANDILEGRMDV